MRRLKRSRSSWEPAERYDLRATASGPRSLSLRASGADNRTEETTLPGPVSRTLAPRPARRERSRASVARGLMLTALVVLRPGS